MLQKKNSTSRSKLKYLLILPLVALMLTYTACKEESKEDIQQLSEQSEAEQLKAQYKIELKEAVAKYGMYSDDMPSKFKTPIDVKNKEDFYRQNAAVTYMVEQLVEQTKNDPDLRSYNKELLEKVKSQTYEDYLKQKNNPTTTVTEIEKGNSIGNVPFAVIENVPVFPGCETLDSNDERKECMSKEISQFVNKNFDVNLAKELNLKGNVRVYVQFKIDKAGEVVDVSVRAPHPRLESEAERVIKKLPTMRPGEQGGEKVGVLYSLPISFRISNKN
jgi:hypothetical protein